MEDMEYQEKSGFFSRLAGVFVKDEPIEDDFDEVREEPAKPTFFRKTVQGNRYHITVRRQVSSFQDAVAAADGLKRGEQQILNLNACDQSLKDKIKDFMCGVNYAEEGTWEELGENVFLLAPAQAVVEVAPASPRMTANNN